MTIEYHTNKNAFQSKCAIRIANRSQKHLQKVENSFFFFDMTLTLSDIDL